ncbi:MAG TPA: PQQ-binding-like beta-propeller repeat protein [Bryobacteraceae bacterium]|nr:PQQ-binding-like beta-propeller repeat protein [Bryobacteraceae bacterium]
MKHVIWISLAVSICLLIAAETGTGDWPMWGGAPGRNMVSLMSGLPTSWDADSGKNVRWVAELGTQTYGNPVVAGGQVYVGTNNGLERNPKEDGDRGVLMCFRESDGQFLWQHTNQKLPSPDLDWPDVGVCSAPLVEDDRLYYVSNRCELVCLDTKGDGKGNARVIWKLDMIKETGSSPHNMSNSSPVSYGGLVFVSTSNGRDENHEHVPAPRAPSVIAVDKKTGKLAWRAGGAGERLLHGQWSSPAAGLIGDAAQVVMGEGDGWVRGYEALSGRKLWEFDTNPKDSVWPKNRNEIISTPVIRQDKVYIANGQDPESGDGPGHLYSIDATKRGDITQEGRVWHFSKLRRSVSTVAIHGGLLFIADLAGFMYCLDAETGKLHWTHDLLAAVWGSPIVIDGMVYIGDEDGDVVVLEASPTKKLVAEMNMGSAIYSTPVPANGALIIAGRNRLWALAGKR